MLTASRSETLFQYVYWIGCQLALVISYLKKSANLVIGVCVSLYGILGKFGRRKFHIITSIIHKNIFMTVLGFKLAIICKKFLMFSKFVKF